jgi:hypothetical protein
VTAITDYRREGAQHWCHAGTGVPALEASVMKRNVGGIDKTLRIIVGIGLLGLLLIVEGGAKWFGLIGLVPLGTALIGYCPLYAIWA